MNTARAAVKLPRIPHERDGLKNYPSIEMARACLIDGRLVFKSGDGFDQALAQGFFLVAIPDEVDTTDGDLFASHFFEAHRGDELDRFRGYRDIEVPGDYQGYFDREHDQWENFYIEEANWALIPDRVARLGHQMTDIGIAILRNVLAYLNIPERDWAEVTSGLSDRSGHHMLAFNHFRHEKAMRGSKFHRDSGWVTVLRSVEPGLLALVGGKLCAINPEPGYFIVNFGSSIEVLSELLPTPVRANIHGVAQTERGPGEQDRMSYVVFLDSNLAGTIYRYEDGRPRALQSVAAFAKQEVTRTYNDDDEQL